MLLDLQVSILASPSSSGHVLAPRRRCSCRSEKTKLSSAFHPGWVTWRRAHHSEQQGCQHSRGSLDGSACGSFTPGSQAEQIILSSRTVHGHTHGFSNGVNHPLHLALLRPVLFSPLASLPSTWGEPGTGVMIWQSWARPRALWRALKGRQAQAPSICKERELGWLCSYPAQEGVHTESLS